MAESSAKYRTYEEGEVVQLLVNKLTSNKDMYPMDYYQLPFCTPEGGPKLIEEEHLGGFLEGDRIETSPYELKMKKDVYCKQLCIHNLGRGFHKGVEPNKVARAIKRKYHNNWIVDGLPAASKIEDDYTVTTRFWGGFPIGFIADEDGRPYVHNHVNIEIMYNSITDEKTGGEKYEIVRFTVEPFSIRHEIEPIAENDDDGPDGDVAWARIINPIPSCDTKISSGERTHTSYDMVTSNNHVPQPASGMTLSTYDVVWTETRGWVTWANRWHVYLYMDDAIPAKVHTYSIANAIMVIIFCAACLVVRISRGLKHYQQHQYQSLLGSNGNPADFEVPIPIAGQHESGIPALYGDVFRVPITAPRMLAVACGTGAQVLSTIIVVILFAMNDLVENHPDDLGESLLSSMLWTYALMGVIGGYTTARFSKTFFGDVQRGPAALGTAFLFPGMCFGFFFIVNMTAWFQASTMAVPFITMVEIILIWLLVLTPLVFVGAYAGFSQASLSFHFPFQPRTIRRPIPRQPRYLRLPFVLSFGVVPFGTMYVEVYFVLAATWMQYFYATFGYLLASLVLCLASCSLVTIGLTYLSYTKENHRWWWRSFAIGGSPALCLYFYSWFYWRGMGIGSGGGRGSWLIYHGYMMLMSLGLFMALGLVGLVSALIFTIFIFRRLGPRGSGDETGYAMIDRE